jgi:hypothetical protein
LMLDHFLGLMNASSTVWGLDRTIWICGWN